MEQHYHTYVGGMVYVHDEDLAEIAATREVVCEHCDGVVRVSWHIEFADRESVNVYSEQVARKIVNREYDPRSFVPGEVTSVVKHLMLWTGSHEDRSRTMEGISAYSVDFAEWRK